MEEKKPIQTTPDASPPVQIPEYLAFVLTFK